MQVITTAHDENSYSTIVLLCSAHLQALVDREVSLADPILDIVLVILAEEASKLDEVALVLLRYLLLLMLVSRFTDRVLNVFLVLRNVGLKVVELRFWEFAEVSHDQVLLVFSLIKVLVDQLNRLIGAQLSQIKHSVLHNCFELLQWWVRNPSIRLLGFVLFVFLTFIITQI